VSARRRLPISPRHRKGCPQRNCGCPWTGRVRLPDGTQPRIKGDTYAEAEQAYYALMARRPEPLADRTTTIAQWAERWLAQARGRRGKWRPRTAEVRRQMVRKHITPGVGHLLVTEMRRDDVALWVNEMERQGAGPASARLSLEILRTMYEDWRRADRLLPRGNPVDVSLLPKPPRKQFPPLTRAQVAAIVAAIAPDARVIVETEAYYGPRVGEVLALREEDITFTGKDTGAPLAAQLASLAALPAGKYSARNPLLRFDRQLDASDATPAAMKNEERGRRSLPFPQWLCALLAAHLDKWPPAGGWLFTNPRNRATRHGTRHRPGHPTWSQDAYRKQFKKAAEKAGVTLPHYQATHALRHHCVSVLRDAGWSDVDIAAWIGDAPETVAQVYGRPMPDAMRRISEHLSAARETAGPALRAVT
jgi:integrase